MLEGGLLDFFAFTGTMRWQTKANVDIIYCIHMQIPFVSPKLVRNEFRCQGTKVAFLHIFWLFIQIPEKACLNLLTSLLEWLSGFSGVRRSIKSEISKVGNVHYLFNLDFP